MTPSFKSPGACACNPEHRQTTHVGNRPDGSTDIAVTCVMCGDTVIVGVEPEDTDLGVSR